MMVASTEGTLIADVSFAGDVMIVATKGGERLRAPLERFARLRGASPEELAHWRLIGRGEGVHWPELDEDVSVNAIVEADRAGG